MYTVLKMIAISDNVQTRRDGPCGTITLNRPNRKNALSREMITMLGKALDDFHQEKKIRAVILTGSGNTFCSGTDLHQMQETAELGNALKQWQEDVVSLKQLIERMLRFPKPLIIAANGWTVGAGMALLLAGDMVVAGKKSQFQIPESRLGLSVGMTVPLLAFRTGAGLAANMLLSANPVSANNAHSAGLIHEIVDDDLIWARGFELASQCAVGARESHQLAKQLLNETIGESLFTQLSIGAANMAAARTTDAAREGVAAFLEKREPNWEAC